MNEEYLNKLMKLARIAAKKDEVPVSALLIYNNKIIAKAYNKRNKTNSILDHAEIQVIKKASKKLKTWHLNDCIIYVTLKPCKMCESIINQSRIKEVYFILDKDITKKEYERTKYVKANNSMYGLEYSEILKGFFKKKRDK